VNTVCSVDPATRLNGRPDRFSSVVVQKPRAGRSAIVVAHASVCVLIIFAGFVHTATAATPIALSWALTATACWAIWSRWWLSGTLFDPYGMFMSSLFLFNAGQASLEIFGLNAQGILGSRFDDETLTNALYMVLLGFNFCHFGALLAPKTCHEKENVIAQAHEARALRAVGWLLLVVSIVPSAVLLTDTTRTILAGGYMAAYQREAQVGAAAGPLVLATFLVPSSLLLLAGAYGRRREKLTAAAVIGLYTVLQVFLGYRSTGIMPACAFLWLWNACETRIRTRWLVAGAVVVIVLVIPVSRETRIVAGSDRMTLDTALSAYASIENPVVSTISEMGGSMAAVAYTHVLVPTSRPFDYGVGYWYAALTIFPNFFWSIHPTIAHGTLNEWLVQTVNPYTAMQQGGLGYSCIAEAYLNFGWIGVPVVMGLIGFGIAALAGSAGRDRRRLALVAILTGFVLKFARDESASVVRAFVWYSLGPYLIVTAIARARRQTGLIQAARRVVVKQ
jgi:hypothetical protein